METKEVTIGDIHVRSRTRKDLGDIPALAKSIDDIGLIHPIVVTLDLDLIVGRRRLAAYKHLKRDTIPAIVTDSFADVLARLKAERDENTCRENLTVSESVALGRKLEPLEREEAKKRQREAGEKAGRGIACADSAPPIGKGKARDKVAKAVGMGRSKFEKARIVITEAEKNPEHADLVAEMDRTGKAEGPHRELRQRQGITIPTSGQRTQQKRSRVCLTGTRVATLVRLSKKAHQVVHKPSSQVSFITLRRTIDDLHAAIMEYLKPPS